MTTISRLRAALESDADIAALPKAVRDFLDVEIRGLEAALAEAGVYGAILERAVQQERVKREAIKRAVYEAREKQRANDRVGDLVIREQEFQRLRAALLSERVQEIAAKKAASADMFNGGAYRKTVRESFEAALDALEAPDA